MQTTAGSATNIIMVSLSNWLAQLTVNQPSSELVGSSPTGTTQTHLWWNWQTHHLEGVALLASGFKSRQVHSCTMNDGDILNDDPPQRNQ